MPQDDRTAAASAGKVRFREEVVKFIKKVPYKRFLLRLTSYRLAKDQSPPKHQGYTEGSWRNACGQGVSFDTFRRQADLVAEEARWIVTYGELCDAPEKIPAEYRNRRAGLVRGSGDEKNARPEFVSPYLPAEVGTTDSVGRLAHPERAADCVLAPRELTPSGDIPSRRFRKVPAISNRDFTGRAAELEALRSALYSGRPAAAVQAIHGAGGIGKTRLARAYVDKHSEAYDVVCWFDAEDSRTLAADYAALSVPLCDRARDAYDRQADRIPDVRRWFAENRRWLLVFDNAESLDTVRGYIPAGATGHTLITSQYIHWQDIAETLQLPLWPAEEAAQYVRTRLPGTTPAEAERLVLAFDRFPLGLAQSTAYIAQTKSTIERYLDHFVARRVELWGAEAAPSDYRATIATTWRMAEAKLSDMSRLVFYVMAVLSPDVIPDLIVSGNGIQLDESAPDAREIATLWNRPVLQEVVCRELLEFSLLEKAATGFLMHRLLQAAVLDSLPAGRREQLEDLAVVMLGTMFPGDGKQLGKPNGPQPLFPHALHLAERIRIANDSTCKLLLGAAEAARKQGRLGEARALLLGNLEVIKLRDATDDLELAASYSKLALVEQDLGNYYEARRLLHEALQSDERHYATDHPTLAVRYSTIAMLERDLGNYAEAQRLLRETLRIEKKHHAPVHPTLATSYSDLALVERDLGNYDEAKRLLRESLRIDEQHYNVDHSTFAASYSNLALVERDLGNYPEAQRLLHEALRIGVQHYAADHPKLTIVSSNLALVERDLGNWPEAQRLLREALRIDERHFAADHPTLATRYSNLALTEIDLRNYVEARRLLVRAIEIGSKRFPPDHPYLAREYFFLARVERGLNNPARAIQLLQDALAIQRLKLPPDHPHLLRTQKLLEELQGGAQDA